MLRCIVGFLDLEIFYLLFRVVIRLRNEYNFVVMIRDAIIDMIVLNVNFYLFLIIFILFVKIVIFINFFNAILRWYDCIILVVVVG